MFGFLFRIIFVVFLARVLAGLLGLAARLAPGDRGERSDPGGHSSGRASGGPGDPGTRAPKPLVDRASAIDVPFTEERPEV